MNRTIAGLSVFLTALSTITQLEAASEIAPP